MDRPTWPRLASPLLSSLTLPSIHVWAALVAASSLLVLNLIHTLIWMISGPPVAASLSIRLADVFPPGFFPSDATYAEPACMHTAGLQPAD